MSKLKVIGNCFIQVEETLYNLKGFKEIEKHTFGIGENPPSDYGIRFTPLVASKESYENGVDGSFIMTEYTEEEIEEWESDFELIISALSENIAPKGTPTLISPKQIKK